MSLIKDSLFNELEVAIQQPKTKVIVVNFPRNHDKCVDLSFFEKLVILKRTRFGLSKIWRMRFEF